MGTYFLISYSNCCWYVSSRLLTLLAKPSYVCSLTVL